MEELPIVLMKECFIKKKLSEYNNNIAILDVYLYNDTDDHSYFNVDFIYIFENQAFSTKEKIYIRDYYKLIRKEKLLKILS